MEQSNTGMPAPATPTGKPAHQQIRWVRVTVALAIVAAATWGSVSLFNGTPSFSATASSFLALSPTDLAVTLKVTNTGSASATPTCVVQAHDPTFQYQGIGSGQLDAPVAPGSTVTTAMHVRISSGAAALITVATVKCS